ncbi:pecanex-like protein 1, partial [Corchorus olitorius]
LRRQAVRPRHSQPARNATPPNRGDDAELADAAQGKQIQAAGKQQDAQDEQAAGPGGQATGQMHAEDGHAEQGQGVDQLVGHAGLENRQ